MARIRYLKPDFFKDEDIKELPFQTRLVFAGLWVNADKEGRGEDRPERLKVEIMPYDKVDIDKELDILAKKKKHSNKPFICRYEIDGQKYYQIVEWHKHQRPHHTEKDSNIPPYNGDLTVKEPLIDGESLVYKGNGKGKGKGNGEGTQSECEVKALVIERKVNKNIPKDLDEVTEFFELTFGNSVEATPFYDHFESNGWKVGGKAPMKCWRSAAKNWMRSPYRKQTVSSRQRLENKALEIAKDIANL